MSAPLSGMNCCIHSIETPNKMVATHTTAYTISLLLLLLFARDKKYALNTSHANIPKIAMCITLSNLNKELLGKDLPGVKVAIKMSIPQSMAGP
jgi:hypothetical protein